MSASAPYLRSWSDCTGLDTAEHWKLIRELRNAVNHEYEDETARLAEFFALLAKETPALFGYFSRLQDFCAGVYGTRGD